MNPIVAIIAPGAMGSAVAARLTEHGIEVRTMLAGRSEASVARARAAGMRDAGAEEIADCDLILSIVPPGEAIGIAERLAPAIARARRKPAYVDCNAVSPATVARIATTLAPAHCAFIDAGIIGPPPKPGARATRIYLAGPDAHRAAVLAGFGFEMPVLDKPVGAASALKMSYAAITKGFTALGAMMMLGAARGGTTEDVIAELRGSQPNLHAWLVRQVPNMYDKAYRWVAEMEEIADFLREDAAARDLFQAAARFYETLARDRAGDGAAVALLDGFCRG